MTTKPKPIDDRGYNLLTARDVARQLGLSHTTIQSWIADGVLRSIQMPGSSRRRVFRFEVDKLIERLREGPLR